MDRKTISFSAALIASMAGGLPNTLLAQSVGIHMPNEPITRPAIDRQITELNYLIQRELSLGKISKASADPIRRELNGIESEASAGRQSHGDRLTTDERFVLQADLDRVKQEMRDLTH